MFFSGVKSNSERIDVPLSQTLGVLRLGNAFKIYKGGRFPPGMDLRELPTKAKASPAGLAGRPANTKTENLMLAGCPANAKTENLVLAGCPASIKTENLVLAGLPQTLKLRI
ncbi:hypothetical protein BHU11_02150 [Tannerella sp. oral taxon 808]|nr:hypothetical protein BHU11_02150 [Tannerella sp. oral taxon 808]